MILSINGIVQSGTGTAIFVMLAGQSNARGQGTPFPSGYTGTITGVKIWNGTAYEDLNGSVTNNNQLGQPQGTYGGEMSLLKELATRYTTVYCMKYAIGSTYLASVAQGGGATNWNPATVGGLFDTLVSYTNLAIAALPSGCVTGGFFWFQGEADSTTAALSNLYLTNIGTFVTDFRTETSQPNLKFYLTRILNITDNGQAIYSPRVRAALQIYAHANYGNIYCIGIDDLPKEADYTHLTAQGYIDLGLRYASSLVTPPAELTTLISTDFTGTTLANQDWQTNGTGISQNNKLIITNNHSGTVPFETTRNCLSRYVTNSGSIYTRCKMSWTDPVQTLESSGGFFIHQDTNNYVGIMTDSGVAGGNAIRIRKKVAGVTTDTAVSGAVNGSEFKIAYNFSTGAYTCYYWSAGAWVSLGTGTAFSGGTAKPFFTTNDSATFTGGDSYTFEEFDFTIVDFSTRRPT